MRFAVLLALTIVFSGCASKTVPPTKNEINSASKGVPIATLSPRYPAYAAANGIQGHVCFLFTVKIDGSVSDLRVYESVPEDVFDYEATRAILKWRFKPAMKDGVVVDAPNMRYCLDFKLSDE